MTSQQDPDRQFARGNPWARAVRPDDEKAQSPVLYVAFGLLSLVLAAVFIAAMVLPPMFMHTLIIRGIRSNRPGMLGAGIVIALIYLTFLYAAGKRLMAPRRARDSAEASTEGEEGRGSGSGSSSAGGDH